MRIFVLYAHPVETSFSAGIHTAVVEELKRKGHEVDDCDLYAEGFDPVMSRQERIDYQNVEANRRPVDAYVERLLAADALVLCFPVWNYGFPAILKGFFDRVFLPGVSFTMVDDTATPALRNIRKIMAVTTYGGSRFRAALVGDPPRRLVRRMLRLLVSPGAPVNYLAFYSTNQSSPAARDTFLAKARALARAF